MEKKQTFKALSKICLNNWHYIDRRVLTLNEGINFFTGHSGSGKSTVIDALQIVLYANTDGRGFFNKAAADDSDRSLIEYLRGMVNIGENNEFQYLRNQNFSSTIVLELEETGSRQKECVGVIFDVETATNEISRLFFWHKGGLLDNQYRADRRCLTTHEVREYLQRTFPKEEFYCGPSNERFRRQLYDVYLGGLDMEKFPRLFKRAIPFRMNIRLEEFVKEYICMEQDIHIEELQESVMQYGQMRARIEETLAEVRELEEIRRAYETYESRQDGAASCQYQIRKLNLLSLQQKIRELTDKEKELKETVAVQEETRKKLEQEQEMLLKEYEEIILQIANSGYASLKKDLESLNETLERLSASRGRWDKTAAGLKAWEDRDVVPNQMLWDIGRFAQRRISEAELHRLKEGFLQIREDLQEEKQEVDVRLRGIKKEEKEAREELKELRQGRKAYPRELEEARYELRRRLQETCKTFVSVHILADMLDIRDETWHNAVEGYLGNNKLLLVVEPKYAKMAMEIYQEMDRKKFFRAAILDTEQVQAEKWEAKAGSLAEELIVKEPYVQAYINFFLGNVMKCGSIEELRKCRIGVTADCMLYHSFRLQHINPENYTRRAYIGETSMRQRIRRLEEKCDRLQQERLPLQETSEQIRQMLQLEYLSQPEEDYTGWLRDLNMLPDKNREKEVLLEKMEQLRKERVDLWEEKKQDNQRQQEAKKAQIRQTEELIWRNRTNCERFDNEIIRLNTELTAQEKLFGETFADEAVRTRYEQGFEQYMESRRTRNFEYLMRQRAEELRPLEKEAEDAFCTLMDVRSRYIRSYPQRTFSTTARDNAVYDNLLDSLQCGELEKYRAQAGEQARYAVEHFKEDFIFKIRYAIKEAYQRKDELNRIISRLDFGKDKYQFVITKNKGPDGRFYRMFMDDSLNINPAQLGGDMEDQLNLFTMEHEQEYGDLMNELIGIFIPPENATREELEEAKKNMEKYADYRTYLSFDMQQIVQGDQDMRIGLSRMIKKNSGGEGQNPLYIALLASFAQIYHINLSPKVRRPDTLRLVILDEAFSKMDAEKVASCISLIRGLGFQAIISATNDKIQNYLENVDKTFVYANPNKKHISIQEFERSQFYELQGDEEDGL